MKSMLQVTLVVSFLAFAGTSFGATILVDVNGGGDYLTIQEGLDAAGTGDVVQVADGTYTENIVWPGVDGITLQSDNGVQNCIIDGGGTGSVITMGSGITADTLIRGFRITGGAANNGGGIHLTGASPTIDICWVMYNLAVLGGGGIYCFNYSSPTISNCWVVGNQAGVTGGGILCHFYSAPTIEINYIVLNTVQAEYPSGGGGIWCSSNSNATINQNNIYDNSVLNDDEEPLPAGSGGGIGLTGSLADITNNLIKTNTAYDGGGVYLGSGSDVSILGNIVEANIAGDDGGGIWVWESDTIILNNMVFDNVAADKGGAIGLYTVGSAVITNNTIADNAAFQGGGIGSFAATSSSVTNNIVVSSLAGDGLFADATSTLANTYNDVWGNLGSDYGGTASQGAGGISADPRFVGGGDYHILGPSPCNDAGDDSAPQVPAVDFDGDPRPVDGNLDTVIQIDIGADEYNEGCWDVDDDGYTSDVCGGDDCDDEDAEVNIGVAEFCLDGIDNDCDGLTDFDDTDCDVCVDGDSDGYYIGGTQCGEDDCDDTNPDVNPEAEETLAADTCADGLDNDCDGLVDDSEPACTCPDPDYDGDEYDADFCGGDDCDDLDPLVNPGMDEVCANGIDDNCDEEIDGLQDTDGDLYTCMDDCDDENEAVNPGVLEHKDMGNCTDGIDNDCDGLLDNADTPDCGCFLGMIL